MIRLEEVDGKNVWGLLNLRVEEEQINFVASNTESIIEAYITKSGEVLPFGIFDDDTPIGFLMIGYNTREYWDGIPPEISKENYSLWRFMIDKRYQKKGYGRKALELAIAYVRRFPCGKADYFWTSCDLQNTVVHDLYSSFGFTENGEFDGEEPVMILKL